jgi:hypothetical protein
MIGRLPKIAVDFEDQSFQIHASCLGRALDSNPNLSRSTSKAESDVDGRKPQEASIYA